MIAIILGIAIGAIAGMVIGILSTKSKNAAIQAQLDAAKAQAETDNKRYINDIAQLKSENSIQLSIVKKDAEQVLNQAKSDAKNALDKALTDAEARYEAAKKEAAKNLENVKREASENLEKFKKEAAENLERTKSELQQQRDFTLKDQQARFEETLAKVTAQMTTATEEMLKQRQKEFSETSGQSIGQILKPLNESIAQMKQAMTDSSKEQSELSGVLKTQIENAMQMSKDAKTSAEELTRAFKHKSKVQGDWGETVLSNLLDGQGARYDIQETMRDNQGNVIKAESGRAMRPDVILHLDHKRDVIIDSKVSMTAFIDYVNAETDEARDTALNAHIASIKKHVDELSKKDYSSYVKPPKVKMDYVIMFVPHSAALWTALNESPTLWSEAMAKKVYIVDEQTLYAALRMIDLTWTQIVQAQNHEKVYDLANEIIDRVGQFMKKYQAIGNALASAQNAYEDGKKKLSPSGPSILNSCGKLLKLGAKQIGKNSIQELTDLDEALAITDAES